MTGKDGSAPLFIALVCDVSILKLQVQLLEPSLQFLIIYCRHLPLFQTYHFPLGSPDLSSSQSNYLSSRFTEAFCDRASYHRTHVIRPNSYIRKMRGHGPSKSIGVERRKRRFHRTSFKKNNAENVYLD